MSFLLNLGDLGTFFSDELLNLEKIVNFISTDFINFANAVIDDLENSINIIYQLLSQTATFIQNAITDIVNSIESFAIGILPTLEGIGKTIANTFTTFLPDLENFAGYVVNSLYGVAKDIGNVFAQFTYSLINDLFTALANGFQFIGPALPNILNLLTPFILPLMIGRGLPTIVEKVSDLLPEFELDLSPLGFGMKLPIKFGPILEKISEAITDILKDINNEVITTIKESLKEPFVSDFKISFRKIFNEIGLGDIPFADPSFANIQNWVAARSFEELKDHFEETLLLTGFPAWFTDAYLQPPVDDYIPRNPLFKPVSIRDIITAVQVGILDSSALSQYAYNNLITPKTAKLMYQNSNIRLLQRAVEQGLRQFVVTPEKAYQEIINNLNLAGKDLYLKVFNLEYDYAVQRIVRQFLRSLLSRALSNFGRPYIDISYLEKTVQTLFNELGYPKEVKTIFNVMIEQSQLIQNNQLLFQQLEKQVQLGIYDKKTIENLLKENNFNVSLATTILQYAYNYSLVNSQIKLLQSQLRSFQISVKDAERELKKLGLASPIIDNIISEYYTEQITNIQLKYYERLIQKGYINTQKAEQELKALGIDKNFIDIFISQNSRLIDIESTIKYLEFLLKNFFISERDFEQKLKALHISDALIQALITQYFQEPFLQLQLKYIEELASQLAISSDQMTSELKKLGMTSEIANIYSNLYYYRYYIPKLASYYRSLASHGILQTSKEIPENLVKFDIQLAYQEYVLATELRYIEENLKDLTISPKDAISQLQKLGLSSEIANLLVNIYTPTLYNIHTLIQNIVDGKLYKVGKVPVDTSGIANELKKLNIPDNQINILIDQYATSFALRIWEKYLPSLSDITNAIRYNYPIHQLVELSFIPAELFNLHANLQQYILEGQEAHSLKTDYINLLTYGVQNSQLEQLFVKYGVTSNLLQLYKLESQIRKLLTMYQELYITPSKALSMSEYLPNPDQFIQKVFTEYNVPVDLQNIYLQYAKNKRLSRYISEIISTINLLFERGKIDLNTALGYLQQFKQYGLTDEEINLIKLNWQLRSMYK
ncbi:hypothetical protein N617_gp26 [Stygiolobus rod-shaped virus]|uniref:Uncharacterized protein n=1 Tax=Stygiolobus rod-shaped virus TaxID=537009 RepID=B6EFD2_9VIRU|nr:hypothetical protein N617_gp26 [Stygiolobus rod-shaped virus]CAQ58467.1 hypothetical protein [Stygiolobus rod-shaped virus]